MVAIFYSSLNIGSILSVLFLLYWRHFVLFFLQNIPEPAWWGSHRQLLNTTYTTVDFKYI